MQRALLALLLEELEPLLQRRELNAPFQCEPGVRLSRSYGMFRWSSAGQAAIQVRCTRDGDRRSWRSLSAIVGTLIHEIAHLKHRRHSAAFWRLCRALLNEAALLGLYSGDSDDPTERPQGRGRLAGSAADAVVSAALADSRRRARAARALAAGWSVGAWARLAGGSRTKPRVVQVVAKRRSRLIVQTASGRRYLVNATLLEPTIHDHAGTVTA